MLSLGPPTIGFLLLFWKDLVMDKPTIVWSALQAGVPAEGGSVDVVVRVQAPDRPAGVALPHLPKRLALVVDRSGSMSGQPLDEALRCVAHIARHLTPQDALALVVYDDQVQVLRPLQPMTDLPALQRLLAGVDSGGSTDLHGGWLAGAGQLEGGAEGTISRVLLLSDGQANHGLTDPVAIHAQCRQWLARGVSTTTVGLGHGFNEDLMICMAQAGGGQNYYGRTAADLFDNFDEELALLQALWLRGLQLALVPAAGVVVQMLSPVAEQADGRWPMSDLAWGAESWLALRLHVSASAAGQAQSLRDLLACSLQGTALDGQRLDVSAPLLQLPVLDAAALAALPRNETASQRLLELAFAEAAQALRALAQQGDARATRRALAALEAQFGENPWLRAKIDKLRELADDDMRLMAKEVQFSAMRMSRRLVAKDETAFMGDETYSQVVPAFLRKKVSEGTGRKREG